METLSLTPSHAPPPHQNIGPPHAPNFSARFTHTYILSYQIFNIYYTISSVCIIRNAIKAIKDHLYAIFKPFLKVSQFCRESCANPPHQTLPPPHAEICTEDPEDTGTDSYCVAMLCNCGHNQDMRYIVFSVSHFTN